MQPSDKGKYLTAGILVAIVVFLFLWTFQLKW